MNISQTKFILFASFLELWLQDDLFSFLLNNLSYSHAPALVKLLSFNCYGWVQRKQQHTESTN